MVFPLTGAERITALRFDRARVKAIIADILAGRTQRQIQRAHGISPNTVSEMRNGRWHPELVAELVAEINAEKVADQTFHLPSGATPAAQ